MSDKIKVAEAIERQAKTYQAIIDAAAMLKEIGSLEQARDEIVKAHLAATDETLAAKVELHNVKADLKKQKDKVAEMLNAGELDAALVRQGALSEAEVIISQAKEKALGIEKAASDRLAGSLADVSANRAKVIAEIGDARQVLEGLMSDIQVKTAEAEEAQKRLDKVQAQIAKLLS